MNTNVRKPAQRGASGWNVNQKCTNCGTSRVLPACRGFCRHCYSIVKRLKKLEDGTYRWRRNINERQAASSRMYKIECCKEDLAEFASREAPVNERNASAIAIESILYPIIAECGSHVCYSLHSLLDNCLDERAKNIVYLILLNVLENIPSARPRKATLAPPSRRTRCSFCER